MQAALSQENQLLGSLTPSKIASVWSLETFFGTRSHQKADSFMMFHVFHVQLSSSEVSTLFGLISLLNSQSETCQTLACES
jgi:hypothetical protein